MIARVFGFATVVLTVAALSVGLAGDKGKDAVKDKIVVKDKDVGKDEIVGKDAKKDVDKDKGETKDGTKDKGDKKDAGKDKIEKKDKGEKKDKEKKDPPKVDLKTVAGDVVAIDFQKGGISVGVDGKPRTFAVNDDTKFVGPKGGNRGMGLPGLKDETLVKGAAVRVVFADDGKVALEVHLPARGAAPPKVATEPKVTPEPINPPAKINPPQSVPQVTPQSMPVFEPEFERVGPVRRLMRRIFGRG